MIDLAAKLPSRWSPVNTARGPVDVQAFASTLRELRDWAREKIGPAHAAGLVTDAVLAAMVKGRAMDVLARQVGAAPVDGAAFAVAVQTLLNHLTTDE